MQKYRQQHVLSFLRHPCTTAMNISALDIVYPPPTTVDTSFFLRVGATTPGSLFLFTRFVQQALLYVGLKCRTSLSCVTESDWISGTHGANGADLSSVTNTRALGTGDLVQG